MGRVTGSATVMAKQNYRIADFIGRYRSRYICESCGSVLYNANDFMKGKYCLQSGCEHALPPQFDQVTPSQSDTPQLFGGLEKERAALATEIRRWDRGFLVRELVAARSRVFKTALATGMTKISNLLAIEKLLLIINQVNPEGRCTQVNELLDLHEQAVRLNESESNVEDLRLGRIVAIRSHIMAHINDGFFMLDLAYMRAYNSDLSVYGLVSNTSISEEEIDDLFAYADIDFDDYGIEDDQELTDAVKTFESLAPTGIQMTRVYNGHWWSSQMHQHMRNPLAMSVLYGWMMQSSDINSRYREHDQDLRKTLDSHFDSVSGTDYSGADFIAEYIDSTSLVPYAPRCPEGLLLDRVTLLMMCIYLYVQEVPEEYVGLSGYTKFQQVFSVKRSDRFTDWLEDRLIAQGYLVPIKEKEFSANGVKREFDLVAVNESKKQILLVEAKYKDIPVTSLNSKSLVPNELEGEDGMLYELVRQHERKDFFSSGSKRMITECALASPLDEYSVQAFVVSKYSPILDALDDVRWLRADRFLELIKD